MRQWIAESSRSVLRLVRRVAIFVFGALLVASVGMLIFSHSELLYPDSAGEASQRAMAVRGRAGHLTSGGRRTVTERTLAESNTPAAVRASSSTGAESEGDPGVENPDRRRPIAMAWAAEVLERATRKSAEWYADHFDISLALARDIHRIARDERIEPDVAFGLVRTESSFRPRVVSWAGAVGLTQLLPSTANWIVPGTHRSELFDVETNLRVGFRYLRHLLDKYNGNQRLALLAYNRGPGTVDGILSRGGDPSNGYAAKVLGD